MLTNVEKRAELEQRALTISCSRAPNPLPGVAIRSGQLSVCDGLNINFKAKQKAKESVTTIFKAGSLQRGYDLIRHIYISVNNSSYNSSIIVK